MTAFKTVVLQVCCGVALLNQILTPVYAAPVSPVPPAGTATEVFTTASILMTGTQGATVYYLDGLEQIKRQLSVGLPADPERAAVIVKERARAMGASLNANSMNASQGIVRANFYGVNRVPAIVFDGRSVVFGVTDVAAARVIYERTRAHAGGH